MDCGVCRKRNLLFCFHEASFCKFRNEQISECENSLNYVLNLPVILVETCFYFKQESIKRSAGVPTDIAKASKISELQLEQSTKFGGKCSEPHIGSTLSSSYSLLDPLCYDHQLTGLYLVRQLTINSLLIIQYIQSNTSTQLDKISSLTEVTLTQLVNISSSRRSADFRRRSAAVPSTCHKILLKLNFT